MKQIASLAALIVALNHGIILGKVIPLPDTLVMGRWEINVSRTAAPDSVYQARWSDYFSADHVWEQVIWQAQSGPAGAGLEYFGIRITGTWYTKDTSIVVIPRGCAGFAGWGQRECEIEMDEILDTLYLSVETRNGTRHLVGGEWQSGFPWAGTGRNVSAPAFWPDSLPPGIVPGPLARLQPDWVTGLWGLSTEDPGSPENPDSHIKTMIYFSRAQAWELRTWSVNRRAGAAAPERKAMTLKGNWSIEDTTIRVEVTACMASTKTGGTECEVFETLPDTLQYTLGVLDGVRALQSPPGQLINVAFPHRGALPDTAPPAFWTAPLLIRPVRAAPRTFSGGARDGRPAFDALGRRPAAPTAAKRYFLAPAKPEPGRP